jgi:hypothetical protein
MNRELPGTIRRTLQAALDRNLASIEETLKNQLENIVRDVHETLARNFLNSVQPSEPSSGTIDRLAGGLSPAENLSTTALTPCDATYLTKFQTDTLAHYSIPSDASSLDLLSLPSLDDHVNTSASFADSGYQSYHEQVENTCFDDAWLQLDPDFGSVYESLSADILPGGAALQTNTPDPDFDQQPAEEYLGKGKGRATPHGNSDTTYVHFGPWVPDRSA